MNGDEMPENDDFDGVFEGEISTNIGDLIDIFE